MKFDSFLIDTIRSVDDDLARRYAWSAWRERFTVLPKVDINGTLIVGRIWSRERWVIDQQLNRSRVQRQHVSNVLDMIRADHV